ncbi:MAG: PCP reductase family protein [Nitrospinales bacterium]
MKFLCIPCDEQMKTQTDGIMPSDSKNLALKFKCEKCGHEIAMLTNQFETEFVSKIGVELGGQSAEAKGPFTMVGSNLDEAKEELAKSKPKDEFAWTEEAMERLNRVPFFVRNMAKKTILDFARQKGVSLIDAKLMDEVRQKVGM